MNELKDMVVNTWDNLLGRVAIMALTIGWPSFLLLSMAHRAITAK